MAERCCRSSTQIVSRSAIPGDHHLAAGRRHILKYQRTLPTTRPNLIALIISSLMSVSDHPL
jgi:hypothetical protein